MAPLTCSVEIVIYDNTTSYQRNLLTDHGSVTTGVCTTEPTDVSTVDTPRLHSFPFL
jgi:hypothetical protein